MVNMSLFICYRFNLDASHLNSAIFTTDKGSNIVAALKEDELQRDILHSFQDVTSRWQIFYDLKELQNTEHDLWQDFFNVSAH